MKAFEEHEEEDFLAQAHTQYAIDGYATYDFACLAMQMQTSLSGCKTRKDADRGRL